MLKKNSNANEKPLFSLLIANYNNGAYLEQCLNSLIDQTYDKIEVIIVDDASTDNSVGILDKYRHVKSFRIFVNEKNFGQGFSKAKCAKLATGDIMGLVDPDDVLLPEAVEKMVEAHRKNPEYSIIYSNHSVCNEKLEIIHERGGVGQLPKGESQLLYNGNKISAFATYKKCDYNKTSGIDTKLERAPDQDLYSKLEEIAPVLFIDIPLYLYRWHEKGLSSMNDNILKAQYWAIIVLRNAYQRRRHKKELIVPKIKWSYLQMTYGNYLVAKSMLETNKGRLRNGMYYLLKSFPYIFFNRQFITRVKIITKLVYSSFNSRNG